MFSYWSFCILIIHQFFVNKAASVFKTYQTMDDETWPESKRLRPSSWRWRRRVLQSCDWALPLEVPPSICCLSKYWISLQSAEACLQVFWTPVTQMTYTLRHKSFLSKITWSIIQLQPKNILNSFCVCDFLPQDKDWSDLSCWDNKTVSARVKSSRMNVKMFRFRLL